MKNLRTLSIPSIKPVQNEKISSPRPKLSIPPHRISSTPQVVDSLSLLELSNSSSQDFIHHLTTFLEKNLFLSSLYDLIQPLYQDLKINFPNFYKNAKIYFQKYNKLQDTTQIRLSISTNSVIPSYNSLIFSWKTLHKELQKDLSLKYHFHIQYITNKFNHIHQTLETINGINQRQEFPNNNLKKTIYNLISLCDSIKNDILSLINQPSFPIFTTDMYLLHSNNVKSFIFLIKEAFINDFCNCGLTISEIDWYKKGIILDCNDTMNSLKNSFSYYEEIIKINELSNKFGNILNSFLPKFSFPNNIIIPKDENIVLNNKKNSNKIENNIILENKNNEKELIKEINELINEKNNENEIFYQNIINYLKNIKSEILLIQNQNNSQEKIIQELKTDLKDYQFELVNLKKSFSQQSNLHKEIEENLNNQILKKNKNEKELISLINDTDLKLSKINNKNSLKISSNINFYENNLIKNTFKIFKNDIFNYNQNNEEIFEITHQNSNLSDVSIKKDDNLINFIKNIYYFFN